MTPPMALPLTAGQVVLIFGLAIAAYALLTVIAVSAAFGAHAPALVRRHRWTLSVATLAIMTAHVILVWSQRFDFDFAIATRNGYGGFVTFHLAFVLSWATMTGDWLTARWRRHVLLVVWLLVSSGAIGAPFRYPIVESFAVPVIAVAALGAAGFVAAYLKRRAAPPSDRA